MLWVFLTLILLALVYLGYRIEESNELQRQGWNAVLRKLDDIKNSQLSEIEDHIEAIRDKVNPLFGFNEDDDL